RRADRRHGADAGDHDAPPTVVHLASVGPRLKPRLGTAADAAERPFTGRAEPRVHSRSSAPSNSRLIPTSVREAMPWMNTGPITRLAASGPTSGHAGPRHAAISTVPPPSRRSRKRTQR